MALGRVAGVLLVALGAGPLYLLLPEASIPGAHALQLTRRHLVFVWGGGALVVGVAAMIAAWVDIQRVEGALRGLAARISRLPAVPFAAALALGAGLLTLLFSSVQLGQKPPFLDAMAQLVHARYLAEGLLSGPTLGRSEFWMFQNLVTTPEGWLSQYPPGHVLLLAAGMKVGAAHVVGPLMMAAAVLFTALAAERLMPEDRAVARLGALLIALSPFAIFLSATFMNHVTAAAFSAMAVYFSTRARAGHDRWAVAAGASIGAVFSVRPLTGLVVGMVVALCLRFRGAFEPPRAPARYLRSMAAVLAGALPFAIAIGLYNAHFFDSPFRFGYAFAQGASHGLGFHTDPWGTPYGLREALGYSAADLVALSRFLLQTPLPLVTIVGVYLIVARRLTTGRSVIVAWAVLPVLANLFYWHHDLIMGPRMLAEYAPAWALLSAVAGVGLVRRVRDGPGPGGGASFLGKTVEVALLLAVAVGLGYMAPRQATRYGGDWQATSRVQPPRTGSPALVFVHEGWSNRLGARLAGRGLRQDSIMRLLADVPPCVLEAHLAGLVSPGGPPPTEVQRREILESCERQVRADRLGTLGLPALVWQGDLPGLPARGPMFVRDLGPEHNRWLLDRYPDRQAFIALPSPDPTRPELLPYDRGVELLWAAPEAETERPRPSIR